MVQMSMISPTGLHLPLFDIWDPRTSVTDFSGDLVALGGEERRKDP